MALSAGVAFIDILPNMKAFATSMEKGLRSSSVQKFGKDMTKYVTLPVVAAGAAAVKMAVDFEATMAQIRGLAGQSAEDVKAWGDQILETSADFGIGGRDAAKALYFIASSGVEASQAMNVLNASMQASEAGLGDVEVVADAVTSAMNAYATTGLTAADATDVLTQAVKLGKGEASQMAPVLGSLLPLASELGIEFSDVGAAIAAMTTTGDSAAIASTKLNAVMSGLLKTTPQAEEVFQQVGLSVDDLRTSLAQEGLLPTLQKIADAVDGDTEALARMFPNVRALRGILSLTGNNAENVNRIFLEMGNRMGATEAAAEEMANTTQGKINEALATLENKGIELGATILPKLASAIEGVTNFFEHMNPQTRDFIVGIVGITAVIGPLIRGLYLADAAMKFLLANPVVLVMAAWVTAIFLVVQMMHSQEEALKAVNEAAQQGADDFAAFVAEGHSAIAVMDEFNRIYNEEVLSATQPGFVDRLKQNLGDIGAGFINPILIPFQKAFGLGTKNLDKELKERTDVALQQFQIRSQRALSQQFREGQSDLSDYINGLATAGLQGVDLYNRALHTLETSPDFLVDDKEKLLDFIGFVEQGASAAYTAGESVSGWQAEIHGLINTMAEQGQLTEGEYLDLMLRTGTSYKNAKEEAKQFGFGVDQVDKALRKSANGMHFFTFTTAKEFEDWANDTTESFDEFVNSQDSLKEAFSLTTTKFRKLMEARAEIAVQGAKDISQLTDMKGVDDAFKQFLIEQGPEYVHAFINGTEGDRNALEESWRTQNKALQDYADNLNHLPGDVDTTVKADTTQAEGALDSYLDKLRAAGFDIPTVGSGHHNIAFNGIAAGLKNQFHTGGHVDGVTKMAGLKSNELMAVLKKGEYVIQDSIVKKPGMRAFLDSLNANALDEFHYGGLVEKSRKLYDAYTGPTPEYTAMIGARFPDPQKIIDKYLAQFGGGRVSPNAARAIAWLHATFPGVTANPGIMVRGFNFAPGPPWSQHSYGNALDITPPSQGLADALKMAASALSVANLIYNRRSSYRGGDWQPYNGTNPHTDHVHADFWPPGTGTPPPGGGWVRARGGFAGRLHEDALIQAHAGERVDITPAGRRMHVTGNLTLTKDSKALIEGVVREELRDGDVVDRVLARQRGRRS